MRHDACFLFIKEENIFVPANLLVWKWRVVCSLKSKCAVNLSREVPYLQSWFTEKMAFGKNTYSWREKGCTEEKEQQSPCKTACCTSPISSSQVTFPEAAPFPCLFVYASCAPIHNQAGWQAWPLKDAGKQGKWWQGANSLTTALENVLLSFQSLPTMCVNILVSITACE